MKRDRGGYRYSGRFRPKQGLLPVLLLILSLLATLHGVSETSSTGNTPQLGNAYLRAAFDSRTGRLASLVDVRNGHDFIQETPSGDIWQIDLLPPHTPPTITPGKAQDFRWQRAENQSNELQLTWQGFESTESRGMCVTVTVSLAEDVPVAFWRIAIDGTDVSRLAALRFPRLAHIRPQENEVLAAPIWMGQQTTRARELLSAESGSHRLEWEYPGLMSLQCFAFYRQNGPGVYLACEDTSSFAKRFSVFGDPDRDIGFEVIHLLQGDAERPDRYEMPYRVITGAFDGDWFTVAERYRRWALRQSWARDSRLATGATADWVKETGLWVWNRGRSGGVLTPAVALQERLGLPVSVFWHWWHGCAYDMGFPEYLPPREGDASFRTALGQAHEAGVHAIVYMNQRLWGMSTRSWADEHAERYAVKGLDGKVRPEVYNTFTHAPCASMCMGTPFWRAKYAGLAEQAVRDLGVDGIYMDQACSSLACYDATHGHPLGGGTYWMNGFRALQADIRDRCRATRNVVLAGEGCGEAWLPYLDLMLSLQVSMERYAKPGMWEPIPFFPAVYHGRAVLYGNYSSLTMPPYDDLWPPEYAPKEPLALLDRKFSQQFRLEQARAFAWGQQPAIANFRPEHLEQRAEEMDYVMRLAKLRSRALKYLLYGTMLRPPDVTVPEEEIDISRLSIYAGQQEALKQYRKTCPAVLSSAWQAPDGDVAMVVVNVTERPQHFSITLDRCAYAIPDGSCVSILDDTGRRQAEQANPAAGQAIELPVDLEPAAACIYEFSRH